MSLAETPARVQVPNARPLTNASTRPKPAAVPQGKTLFGLPAVAIPPMREGAPSPAAAKPAVSASLPAVGLRVSTPEVAKEPVLPSAGSREPADNRTEDVSLSDMSAREQEWASGAQDAAATPSPHVPSMVVSDEQSVPARTQAGVEAPGLAPLLRNVPSTEPAPRRPSSALKYGIWAAVPVGLCAAWFVWRSPLADMGIQATEVALKSEQKVQAAEPSPAPAAPVAAPAAAPASVAEGVPEATGAVLAAPEAVAPAPTEEEPGSPSAMAPEGEPTAQAAPAEAAGELDADAEDADNVELDASRKAVAVVQKSSSARDTRYGRRRSSHPRAPSTVMHSSSIPAIRGRSPASCRSPSNSAMAKLR